MFIAVAVVMLLYQGGSVIEHTYHDGISSCLKQKRSIERYGWKDSSGTRYSCEKRKVELELETKEVIRLLD